MHGTNLQQPDLVEASKYYTHTVRIDHNVSEKQRIYGRGSNLPPGTAPITITSTTWPPARNFSSVRSADKSMT